MATYDELKAAAEKFADAEIVAEMEKHALALTVLWREADNRSGRPARRIGEHRPDGDLFVSVYLTDRSGVHVNAFKGKKISSL